jgi:hypothetical protein
VGDFTRLSRQFLRSGSWLSPAFCPYFCADALDSPRQVIDIFRGGARVDVARADGKGAADLSARGVVAVCGVQPLDDLPVQIVDRRIAAWLLAQLRRDIPKSADGEDDLIFYRYIKRDLMTRMFPHGQLSQSGRGWTG